MGPEAVMEIVDGMRGVLMTLLLAAVLVAVLVCLSLGLVVGGLVRRRRLRHP